MHAGRSLCDQPLAPLLLLLSCSRTRRLWHCLHLHLLYQRMSEQQRRQQRDRYYADLAAKARLSMTFVTTLTSVPPSSTCEYFVSRRADTGSHGGAESRSIRAHNSGTAATSIACAVRGRLSLSSAVSCWGKRALTVAARVKLYVMTVSRHSHAD